MTTKLVGFDPAIITAMLFKHSYLVGLLGWQDIRQRYRRSKIGQFWITISMGVMVLCLGVLFGRLFNTPLDTFLPFLATGLIAWGFLSTALSEGCLAFISAESIIKQLPIPLGVHCLRVVYRNLLVLAHNLVIIPLIWFFLNVPVTWSTMLFLPGLLLVSLNLAWAGYLLGVLCTRFRDLTQIVQNFLQVSFYLTPIIWLPALLKGRAEFMLVQYNPFYHLIELLRAPLLGASPSAANWLVGAGLLAAGSLLAARVHKALGHRVAYWL
jgi:ABC-type polysaccharide/polyol phosphate export permease